MKKHILKHLQTAKTVLYENFKFFYRYDAKLYEKTFLEKIITKDKSETNLKVDEVIYCFWTGSNEMSENRKLCLNKMIEISEVKVVLITRDNYKNYIVPDFPLHESYQYLSDVHKSDYLRAYFMHHHGGGYSDIKTPIRSWKNAFKHFKNKNIWIVGNNEKSGIAVNLPTFKVDKNDYKHLYNDMRKHFRYILKTGSFIVRPQTRFTKAWLERLNEILDREYSELKENPGNIRGDNEGYPIYYFSILAQIFQPLCLKFHKHIKVDRSVAIKLTDYR